MTTLYETLEVTEKASPEVIRGAYKYLSQTWHPDKNQGNAEAGRRMSAINAAFDILSDPSKRAQYDDRLRQERAAKQAPPPKPPPRPPPSPPPAAQKAQRAEPPEQDLKFTPRAAPSLASTIGSKIRLALVVGVSGWLLLKLLGSVPDLSRASGSSGAVGGYNPPAGAACVLLASSSQKDLPNDAVVSYKVRNKGNGTGTLTVSVDLQTSRGKSVQQREHRLDAGEERSSYIAFSLAGTDGNFRHFVRCTP